MKLEIFNELLSKLSAEPNQQNLLNVAHGLMEWMGIEHTEKPKILTPKTDKLRKYLQIRKELSRPDLRVISAPEQPIEVRIGMLHNIGKNQLYYLVDRDTRIDAWQNEPGPIQKRSKTPYIFHFATDSRYDRLLFILHQNGQKRIMILRDRLSQTQYNKILQAIENVGKLESKYEIQERLWNCLDLKEVNKSFYKEVKTKYDALVEILRAKYTVKDAQESQFAVRLIGRYIFCWFLKEKGIIHQSIIESKTTQLAANFYDSILKKLFFNTLNTEVGLRDTQLEVPEDIQTHLKRIPYLNGGLFDYTAEDQFFQNVEINDWLTGFVKVLEQYDFTVDESSPSYQQIAIDPEMLGRIFENLLASINPETEKLANERKAFGAFYTPREIVEYMVNQSLRCYLETHLLPSEEKETKDDLGPVLVVKEPAAQLDIFRPTSVQTVMEVESGYKKTGEEIAQEKEAERRRKELSEKLDKFFEEGADNPFSKEETALVRKLLNDCKVLDPACGSGAFPMGVLYKLEQLHETLGVAEHEDELRLRILSNNIFGVDIMPMAVDISRLRAWLSIVLVAEYKPNQPKNNFNVHPLPNLDFKFVCANTLIDVPEDEYVKQMAHDDLARFDRLTREYFGAKFQHKDELKAEIQACLNSITSAHDKTIESLIRESEKHNKSNKKKSKEYEQLKERYAKEQKRWRSYTHIFENKPVEFFKTRYFFPAAENGFDVVIGNPPYVQVQKLNTSTKLDLETQQYECYASMGDLYTLFYERGFDLLSLNGVLSFITSNKWLKAGYGEKTRGFIAKSTRPIELIDFGSIPIFQSVTVDTNILTLQRAQTNRTIKACKFENDWIDNNSSISTYYRLHSIVLEDLDSNPWTLGSDLDKTIKEKMKSVGVPLSKWSIEINYGIKTGLNEAFIIDGETRDRLIQEDPKSAEIIKPILLGKDIKRYALSWSNHFLINSHNGIKSEKLSPIVLKDEYPILFEFLKKYEHKLNSRQDQGDNWWNLRNCAYLKEFAKPKIVWGNLAVNSQFTFIEDELFINAPSPFFVTSNLYLLAILNSKIGSYFIKSLGVSRNGGYTEFKPMFVEQLPIPQISDTEQHRYITIVEQILSLKKKNSKSDTSALERQIDLMVYHLYGLTLEEAQVVDASVGEEEFEAGKRALSE